MSAESDPLTYLTEQAFWNNLTDVQKQAIRSVMNNLEIHDDSSPEMRQQVAKEIRDALDGVIKSCEPNEPKTGSQFLSRLRNFILLITEGDLTDRELFLEKLIEKEIAEIEPVKKRLAKKGLFEEWVTKSPCFKELGKTSSDFESDFDSQQIALLNLIKLTTALSRAIEGEREKIADL